MSAAEILLVGNDMTLELAELRDRNTGAYLNNATAAVTLLDAAGVNVSGATWPLSMAYVAGSDGTYRAILPAALALAANGAYTARIAVTGPSGQVGRWDMPCVARTRRA